VNVLDLFSGIGGFSLGLERAGMRTIAFCEIDAFKRSVLARHWPDVCCHDDVRSLASTALPHVDVIAGGFPCQNVSIAAAVHGGDSGLDGEQSGLWSEYFRLIKEIRPKFAIIENVDRLAGHGLDRVLRSLAAIRYDAQWDTLPGWLVGVPQARPRIWIVAYPAGKRMEGLFARVRALADGSRWPGGPAHLLDIADAAIIGSDRFPQPLLRGMDDRPTNWVDRVHACGDAVIPQIPEAIGRAILAADEAIGGTKQ
jgi:DNA (cytosine-5)-methyltransferase 1